MHLSISSSILSPSFMTDSLGFLSLNFDAFFSIHASRSSLAFSAHATSLHAQTLPLASFSLPSASLHGSLLQAPTAIARPTAIRIFFMTNLSVGLVDGHWGPPDAPSITPA